MKTVVLGPRPQALEALIQRRQALGLDIHDEVWDGAYHRYREVEASAVLGVDLLRVASAVDWPPLR
jgi:hypothetical protein